MGIIVGELLSECLAHMSDGNDRKIGVRGAPEPLSSEVDGLATYNLNPPQGISGFGALQRNRS